jgi:prepilin-type N-terminal cleavage/methylation domain-containing protein
MASSRRHGFTLVELMIVVVILGILAAIAIPVYLRFVQQSKTGEAQWNLAKIATNAQQYYARSANVGSVPTIEFGGARQLVGRFPGTERTSACAGTPATNAEAVPLAPADVQAKVYQPGKSEWRCSTARNDTTCLSDTAWDQMKFALQSPIRFHYCYESDSNPTGDAPLIQHFAVYASSDLNANGIWSQFKRQGNDEGGQINLGPLAVINEGE